MPKLNTLSAAYTAALAELTGFIDESKKMKAEQKPKKKPLFFGKKEPVPRGESVNKTNENAPKDSSHDHSQDGLSSEEGEEILFDGTDDIGVDESLSGEEPFDDGESKDEDADMGNYSLVKSDLGQHPPGMNITPRPRFVEANDLSPTISIECAQAAIDAMRTLREIQGEYRRYILVFIRDDGSRQISRFRTREAALSRMHSQMDFYINEIEPKDKMRVVYRDDGDNEHIYEPTPEDEIDEDGTIKRPSEIDNTLHRIETDSRGIVYFETKNATARWDVYDLEDAEPGDPDDFLYEKFKEDHTPQAAT